MSLFYLDENTPFPEPVGSPEWQAFASRFGSLKGRVVGRMVFSNPRITVSTVFLGIDHRFDTTKGKPILYETLIVPRVYPLTEHFRLHFRITRHRKYLTDYSDEIALQRWETFEQARVGHQALVRLIEMGRLGRRHLAKVKHISYQRFSEMRNIRSLFAR